MNILAGIVIVYIAATCIFPAQASEDFTANITVKVTVVSAPCDINNNKVIDVDFGDSVVTTDVMMGKIEKPINYTLDCSNADVSKLLQMIISGDGASFDPTLLQTSLPELGVKIKANGTGYDLNTALNFGTVNDKPELTAVLVGKTDARLPTGGFTAGATMTVAYQ